MDLSELRARAEAAVSQEYDAWADLSGAEREYMVFRAMLQLTEAEGIQLNRYILTVAREAWTTNAWAWTGHETFIEFLCDVGGRYRNADGRPSGAAYDLAGFVSIAWPMLEQTGYDPVEIGAASWSKARILIPTARRLALQGGQEKAPPQQEVAETWANVVRMVTDDEINVREMAAAVAEHRDTPPPFVLWSSLNKDGTWSLAAEVSDQQFNLVQRLLGKYAEVHFPTEKLERKR